MGKGAILKEAREAVRAGEDRQQVFTRYQGQIARPMHLAVAIAGVPHPGIKEKCQVANVALLILLILAAVSKVWLVISIFPSLGVFPLLGLAVVGVLLPAACAIEVARFNGQIYALIPLFCLMSVFQIAMHFNGDVLGLVLDTLFLTVIAVLSLWIKRKAFPNFGLGGVKKDAQGQYLL